MIWNSPRRNRIILKSSSVNQSTRASSSQTSKQASLPPPPPHQTHNNLIKQLPNSTLKFVNKLKQKFRLTKPGKTVGRQVGGLAETSNLESINLESETSPLSKSSVIEPHLDNHDSLINQETLIAQPSSSSSSDSDSLFHVWDHTHCSITDDEDEDYNGNHDVQLTSNQFEYHSSPAFMQLFDDDEVGGTTSSTSERFFRGTDDLLSFTLDRKKERSARQQQRRHRRNSSIGRLSIISDCEGGSGSSSSGSFNILTR